MIEFTVPYPPPANHRLIPIKQKKGVRMILHPDARAYHTQAGLIANTVCKTPLTGNVEVSFYSYRPRKVGDIDSVIKILLDSMTGIIYTDDKQVIALHVYRGDDAINPRVRVCVRAASTSELVLGIQNPS